MAGLEFARLVSAIFIKRLSEGCRLDSCLSPLQQAKDRKICGSSARDSAIDTQSNLSVLDRIPSVFVPRSSSAVQVTEVRTDPARRIKRNLMILLRGSHHAYQELSVRVEGWGTPFFLKQAKEKYQQLR